MTKKMKTTNTDTHAEARARALAIKAFQQIGSILHRINKLSGMLPGGVNVELEDSSDPKWLAAQQRKWGWLDQAGEWNAGLRQLGDILSRIGNIHDAYIVAECLVGDGTNEKQEKNSH